MINNSLTLIGYAISDYEVDNPKNPYSSLNLRIEVEFYGWKLEDERIIVVNIPYRYIKRIDTEKSVLGKNLIIEGLLMPKVDKDTGEIKYIPTAKDIYVIGEKKNKIDFTEISEGDEIDGE